MLLLQYTRSHYAFPVLLLVLAYLLSGVLLLGQTQAARVDEALTAVCGEFEERASYSERLQLIHGLPSGLAQEQLERCREFLESPLAGQSLPDFDYQVRTLKKHEFRRMAKTAIAERRFAFILW